MRYAVVAFLSTISSRLLLRLLSALNLRTEGWESISGTIAAWDPTVNFTKATLMVDNSTETCSNGATGAP
jgi:hypothetical protein